MSAAWGQHARGAIRCAQQQAHSSSSMHTNSERVANAHPSRSARAARGPACARQTTPRSPGQSCPCAQRCSAGGLPRCSRRPGMEGRRLHAKNDEKQTAVLAAAGAGTERGGDRLAAVAELLAAAARLCSCGAHRPCTAPPSAAAWACTLRLQLTGQVAVWCAVGRVVHISAAVAHLHFGSAGKLR